MQTTTTTEQQVSKLLPSASSGILSSVGEFVVTAGLNGMSAGAIALINSQYPDLKRIFTSLKEMKVSIKFIRSIREEMLGKLRNSELMSQRLSVYFQDEIPFLDIDHSPQTVVPEQVSQFKKILNALHYAEKVLEIIEKNPLDAEGVDGQTLLKDLNELIGYAHELIHISSRLDVNLNEYFSSEMTQLFSLISVFGQYAGPQVDHFLDGSMWHNLQSIASVAGYSVGVAVDQLQPRVGKTDFHFLTSFGGALAGHLSALTSYISSYSSSIEPRASISQDRINELNLSANEMYQRLQWVQASGVIDPVSIGAMLQHPFVYKEIFRHMTKLSSNILEQMNNVHSGTQDAVLNQLSELKNKHLLDLFCFMDKMELYSAFKPGTLSKPLLKYLKTWYVLIVTQASSVVDVTLVRPDLLVIEDSHFVHARMEKMLSRLATLTTQELGLVNVSDQARAFFDTIESFSVHTMFLREVASASKLKLLSNYQFIRPFIVQKNPALDLRLLRDLGHEKAQNVTEEPAVTISECFDFKQELAVSLAKSKTSQLLYRNLAEDMLEGIFSRTDTLILPYTLSSKNPFIIDESQMLGMTERQPHDPRSQWFIGQEHLFLRDELLHLHDNMPRLYEGYQIYLHRLAFVKKACELFCSTLETRSWEQHKHVLCNLYIRIQPYLMHSSGDEPESQASRAVLDRSLIECLHESHVSSADDSLIRNEILRLTNATLVVINHHEAIARKRGEIFAQPTKMYLAQQVQASTITLDPVACKRVHHVFSHERYSAMVHQLSDAVRAMIPLFSRPIQEELNRATQNDVPFPEIDVDVELLRTSDQLLLLKQLMNALYHLEDFFKQMEMVKNRNIGFSDCVRSPEKILEFTGNAYYLFKSTLAFINVITIMNTVRDNPKFTIMLRDVVNRIEHMQGIWFKLKPLYSISSTQVGNSAEIVTSNGTWYSILGMTVLPEHLKALKAGVGFSPEDAKSHQILAKETTLRIEQILGRSSTNLQLFLGSPEMIRVFNKVKESLSQFSAHTYEAVITHLQLIREVQFPAILVETDEWEQKLGIVPGTISTPVKKILDQFYLGLIEPLGLSSEEQLKLVSSLVAFDVRHHAFNFKMKVSDSELFRLESFITILKRFEKAIAEFSPGVNMQQFRQCFEPALPLLMEQRNLHRLGLKREDENKDIDELCHRLIPHSKDLAHIKFLTIRCLANYEGRRNTQRLTQTMIHEHQSALLAAKSTQIADNHAYKTQYVTQLLHRYIDRLVEEQKDIHSLRDSYGETLRAFLLAQEEAIVCDLVSRECTINLQGQLEALLNQPLQQFAETAYRDFMKLQSILVAVNAFECYLEQENTKLSRHEYLWFESSDTLRVKREHIGCMRDIAMDPTKSAEIRLCEIQAILSQPNVQTDLTTYHQYDRLSWDGLKQLFWQLLQAVGLYTPGYQVEYARLENAANRDAPDSAQFLQSYGLFNVNSRRSYSLPPGLQMELTPSTP